MTGRIFSDHSILSPKNLRLSKLCMQHPASSYEEENDVAKLRREDHRMPYSQWIY